MNEFVEKVADYIKSQLAAGKKVTIETSNETMHLDLETGEIVSDSYVEEVWNPPGSADLHGVPWAEE